MNLLECCGGRKGGKMKYPYTVTLTMPDGKRKYYRGKTKKEAEAKRDKDEKDSEQKISSVKALFVKLCV